MNAAFYRINNLSDDYSFVTSHHYSTARVGVFVSGLCQYDKGGDSKWQLKTTHFGQNT
jgi:hypothetical protein